MTAAVSFYGMPPGEAVKPADVKIPLQGHFANHDDFITPKVVNDFETALNAAKKDVEFFRYDAHHAFVNEQRMAVHDRHAAELAWSRADRLLEEASGVRASPALERRAGAGPDEAIDLP